jgi:hypothetical protein
VHLILYNRGDVVVPQLEHALVAAGAWTDIVYLDDLELTQGVGWDFVDPDTGRSAIRLPDGRRVHDVEVSAVINRLRWIEPPNFPKEADREYGAMETYALLVAWLERLPCEVVNRATPRGLAGAERNLAEWYSLAGRVGMATRAMRYSTVGVDDADGSWIRHDAPTDRWGHVGTALHPSIPSGRRPMMYFERTENPTVVHVVRDKAFGAPNPTVANRVRALASAARLGIAEFELGWSLSRSEWVLVGGSPFPEELPPGGVEELAGMCLDIPIDGCC